MAYWLVKQEPETYSFAQFQKDKQTAWTGVRSYQARNNLQAMALGDEVFYYHSVTGKAIVGLARVVKTAYPDPTVDAEDAARGSWFCVDLQAGVALPKPITLEAVKAHPQLKKMALAKLSRLSVTPVSPAEAKTLRKLGGLDE